MNKFKAFLKRKDIIFSAKRYGIDAMSAMAQGLFCSLLIGTIINTLGTQFGLPFLNEIGGFATSMSGPAMACAIGYALKAPPLVLYSLLAVGASANSFGGAGGPLAVLFIAIIAAELGKAVSKETRIDLIVTPFVTIFSGVALSALTAPYIGAAANAVGQFIKDATVLHPFLMGIVVSVLVGIALTLPISSAAICRVFLLTGLAGMGQHYNTGKAVSGFHGALIGLFPQPLEQNLGAFDFGPNQLLNDLVALGIDGAAHAALFFTKECYSILVGLGVSTGRNGYPVPGVGPRLVAVAIAEILCAAAPTVAVVVDAGDLEVPGDIIGLQGQSHLGDRFVGFSMPVEGVVADRLKAVGAAFGNLNGQNGLPIQRDVPNGIGLLELNTHMYDLRRKCH